MNKSPILAVLLGLLITSSKSALSSEDLRAKANSILVQAQKSAVFEPDIHGSPFHEHVDFLFSGLVQGERKGTFVRDWVSKEQWRWKWELPDFQAISVRNGKQIGERETAEFESVRIQQLRWALPPFPLILGQNDLVKRIEPAKVNGLDAQCIRFEAVRGRDRWDREICVNAANNTLARWTDERRQIEWTNYIPFRETFYPRHLSVREHGNKIIEADIEFRDAPEFSQTAFEIPSDMRVRKACEHFTQPIVTKEEKPEYPRRIGVKTIKAEVVVQVKVGVQGKVEAAQITETGGDDLDRAALDAVKKWEFEPAKCDGDPVSHKLPVAIHFGDR
jgi:TonB family protein